MVFIMRNLPFYYFILSCQNWEMDPSSVGDTEGNLNQANKGLTMSQMQ